MSMVGAMNVPNPGGPNAIAQNATPRQPPQPREKKLLFNLKDIPAKTPEPAAAKPDAAVPKSETSAPKPRTAVSRRSEWSTASYTSGEGSRE